MPCFAFVLYLFVSLAFTFSAQAQNQTLSIDIDGQIRSALVVGPQKPAGRHPLVVVLHGKGGKSAAIARKTEIHKLWPEAICVYPQGLWVNAGRKAGFGWRLPRRSKPNGDVLFVEKLLDTLISKYSVDQKRIYAMGHSNGASMTYGLWSAIPQRFAAFAISASDGKWLNLSKSLTVPKPVMVVGYRQDEIIRFEDVCSSVEILRALNGIRRQVEDADSHPVLLRGENHNDILVYYPEGSHTYQAEVSSLAVGFFKKHKLK